MTPEDLTSLGLRIILLGVRSKKPATPGSHDVTTDPARVRAHRGNKGLMAGTHAVLDVDDGPAMSEMMSALGPLQPTVETGSGKLHFYVQHVANLPRYFFWHGMKVGEIIRLPTEYAVCPWSIHPDTGRPYRWLTDPREPFQTLPEAWRSHLLGASTDGPTDLGGRPDFIVAGDTTGADFADTWDGPPADELLRRALLQPGARRRSRGVKFQCPGCHAEGHDKHKDNALVRVDGRFGCPLNKNHRAAIAVALGVIPPEIPDGVMPGAAVKVTVADLDADWTGGF